MKKVKLEQEVKRLKENCDEKDEITNKQNTKIFKGKLAVEVMDTAGNIIDCVKICATKADDAIDVIMHTKTVIYIKTQIRVCNKRRKAKTILLYHIKERSQMKCNK